ncbi:MAG: TerC family protein [Burkholderiales bacterium]|jgi:YjbE family integral membrane protein|nr:TerC family protein [Burkholderiales bacterium]
MELFTFPWWSALLTIVIIDLVLAGDNAIVIALAARNLPAEHQNKAIVWGTIAAIVVRSAMTVCVVWLLQIPGLMFIGGLGLLWIAYKLISDSSDDANHSVSATTFWSAMKTIVVADALMGIDNVLGVAGAANGSFDLVVIGLLISIPIVVMGSRLVLRLVERWPIIIYLGAAVLAFTAAQMLINEQLLDAWYDGDALFNQIARVLTYALAILGVLGLSRLTQKRQEQATKSEPYSA